MTRTKICSHFFCDLLCVHIFLLILGIIAAHHPRSIPTVWSSFNKISDACVFLSLSYTYTHTKYLSLYMSIWGTEFSTAKMVSWNKRSNAEKKITEYFVHDDLEFSVHSYHIRSENIYGIRVYRNIDTMSVEKKNLSK